MLKENAIKMLVAFHIANASKAVEDVGSRGLILKEAMDDLQKELSSERPVADYTRDIGWAVLMFDQANTNQVIVRHIEGGVALRDVVEDIRKELGGEQAVWDFTRDMGTWREGYTNPPKQGE